jgi:hypothetical protein
MLSGVTGGVFPPPPQASSNPDRKKLDTKARELNRITSSQSVRKASLSHSAFVERVPGARAAFAGDACRGCLWNGAPAESGKRSTHSRTSRNTLFPSFVACKDYVESKVRWIHGSEAGRTLGDSREIVARNLPERHVHGRRRSGPCFSLFAGIQPMTAMPPRRGLAGCESA